jgi:hypothetical protein
MANIAVDQLQLDHGTTGFNRVLRRLRVLVRAYRMARARRVDLRLIQAEIHDPRWFADLGLDPRKYPTYDWIAEMTRAMGGRL